MRRIILVLHSVLFIAGCTAFKSSRTIDMTPFSENASTMFSEATKISRPFQWKHLNPYTSIPEFQAIYRRSLPLLEALRGIVYHSNQVVAINNSKLSNRERNNQLAHYLYEAMEKALSKQNVDSLQLGKIGGQRILDNIRQSENYLDGIAAAGPASCC